jgi:hypothetical protein
MNFAMCLICVKTWFNLLTRMALWQRTGERNRAMVEEGTVGLGRSLQKMTRSSG